MRRKGRPVDGISRSGVLDGVVKRFGRDGAFSMGSDSSSYGRHVVQHASSKSFPILVGILRRRVATAGLVFCSGGRPHYGGKVEAG